MHICGRGLSTAHDTRVFPASQTGGRAFTCAFDLQYGEVGCFGGFSNLSFRFAVKLSDHPWDADFLLTFGEEIIYEVFLLTLALNVEEQIALHLDRRIETRV